MVWVWEKSADAFINMMPSLDKNFTQAYYLVYVKCPNAIRMKVEGNYRLNEISNNLYFLGLINSTSEVSYRFEGHHHVA